MKVRVVKVRSKYLVLRWTCPETGKTKQKSARTNDRRKAERIAGQLEDELRRGTYFEPNKITFEEFREVFEDQRFPNLKPGSGRCYESTFNRIEKLVNPNRLSELDAITVTRFQNKLRELGVAETTVSKHLRHLKAALRWAKSMGFVNKVPDIHFPKRGRHQQLMKGRPISDEEFEAMLKAVVEVIGDESAESWNHLIRGIWLSGLRLGEALALTWHPSNSIFVDLTGSKYPMFRIKGIYEKGGKDRLLPMTPDFSEYLAKVGIERSGFVFNPGRIRNGRKLQFQRTTQWVSKVGSRIGKKAKIIVSDSDAKKKYASFHDLRRSFGDRWSRKVMPQILMKLMRHESIDTTLRYYVGHDAAKIAEELWKIDRT